MGTEQQPQGVPGKIEKVLNIGQGELSPEQQALLPNCNLSIKQKTALGGLMAGPQRVITGTINGEKVEIIFDPSYLPNWIGGVEAKVDGKPVPEKQAKELRDKYRAIAEFQTQEAIQHRRDEKRNIQRPDTEKSKFEKFRQGAGQLALEKLFDLEATLASWGIRKIPSTTANAEDYRRTLFPEQKKVANLIDSLKGKFIIDVASGQTHKNPYSLINLIHQDSLEKTDTLTDADKNKIQMFGIDPKAAEFKNENEDSFMSLLFGSGTNMFTRAAQKDTPAEKSVIAGVAESLPIREGVADIILSNFFLAYWVRKPQRLLVILKEFQRTLKSGGEIRIYPTTLRFDKIINSNEELRLFVEESFTREYIPTENKNRYTLVLKRGN